MARTICDECKGTVVDKKVDFKLYGESLGFFPAQVCLKCGEELFTEETSDRIDEAARKKGLWGLSAKTKIARVGTSVGVTINKRIADFMDLKIGNEISVHPESKRRLIIEIS